MSIKNTFSVLLFLLSILYLVYLAESTPTISKRIIGGNDTDIKKYRYFATITFMDLPMCGGAIVTSSTIVTSASCIYLFQPSMVKVSLDSSLAGTGDTYLVRSFCHHPLFVFKSPYVLHDYDVSIVELSSGISYATYQIIGIRNLNYDIPTGDVGVEVGFGSKGWGGPRNERIQVIALPRIRDIDCWKTYPNLTDRMVCFGGIEGKDACGTSGSPLVHSGALSGVDSFSVGCGQANVPRVYTRIYNPDIYNFVRNGRCP